MTVVQKLGFHFGDHIERQRSQDARHPDKRMVYRLILWLIFTQLLLVWIAIQLQDSQRVLNIVQRFADSLTLLVSGAASALYTLMRISSGDTQTRVSDKPPNGGSSASTSSATTAPASSGS